MFSYLRSDLVHLTAYTSHPKDLTDAVSGSPPAVIDQLDTNENPYNLPDDIQQKLAWTLQTSIESNRYPDGGQVSLKQAIADYVNESAHLDSDLLTQENISVGNGSDELIRSILIATCLGGAGSVLVAEPTFSMYAILAQTLGIPVVRVGRASATFEMDLDAAQAAIAQTPHSPIRVVFVVHPNSPTANALTAAEVDWLKSLSEEVLVVIDEAYFEFSQTTLVQEVRLRSNWLALRTFSKAFRLAAHRVGYAIAQPELVAVLEKIRLPYNLSSVSQVAAQIVLAHRQQLLEVIPQLLQERERLVTALTQHPSLHVWPSQANFIYVTLATQTSEQNLATIHQTLHQQGTLIRRIADGFRITIGTPDENTRTLARLRSIL